VPLVLVLFKGNHRTPHNENMRYLSTEKDEVYAACGKMTGGFTEVEQ